MYTLYPKPCVSLCGSQRSPVAQSVFLGKWKCKLLSLSLRREMGKHIKQQRGRNYCPLVAQSCFSCRNSSRPKKVKLYKPGHSSTMLQLPTPLMCNLKTDVTKTWPFLPGQAYMGSHVRWRAERRFLVSVNSKPPNLPPRPYRP